jgi:hypothetical protein
MAQKGVRVRDAQERVQQSRVSQIPDDFEQRFNYRPWLMESFVDRVHSLGTCYQAANRIRVSRAQGRGRQDRFRRAIAIKLIIAWRIMVMTLLGRETPELPAEVLFSDVELRTLRAYAKKGLKPPLLPGEAVRLVAKIGGYLGRNNDPPPGHQLIWQGYAEFQFMCLGFALRDD